MELQLKGKISLDPSAIDPSEGELVHTEVDPEKNSSALDYLSETTCDPGASFRKDEDSTDPQFQEEPKPTFSWDNSSQNGSYSTFSEEENGPTNVFALSSHISEPTPDEVIRFSDILTNPFVLRESKASLRKKTAKKTASSPTPLECGACSKAFLQKNSLIRHLRLHTGERPFVCNVCEKAFSQKNILDSHMRVHTGERPYVCPVCSKGHAKDADLKRHVRTHTGEKPFTCDICNKAFSQSAHLKMHLRMHSKVKPFACGVCEKTFARNSHLKVHMLTHTKEKRFPCDKCDKAFSLNCHLTRHQRTHTGERPFVCDMCEKAFFRRDRMKEHLRNHHADAAAVLPEDR